MEYLKGRELMVLVLSSLLFPLLYLFIIIIVTRGYKGTGKVREYVVQRG